MKLFPTNFLVTEIKYLGTSIRGTKAVSFDSTIYSKNETIADNAKRLAGK